MDNRVILQRLSDLRDVMRRERLAAFIFPTSDPHQSEYTADHWKGREFISGFNGSAGTAVVTLTSAALWTDSRYFIAAAEQLEGTGMVLMKEKVDGTPTIAQWIGQQLRETRSEWTEVGIDGLCSSTNEVQKLIKELRQEGGLTLRTNFDPLRQIWANRPPMPVNPVCLHPMELAGETTASKLGRIRRALHDHHADGMLMARLDDIAWTLNLRGDDVHCNPVFVSYLLISSTGATLYINKVKLTTEVAAYLKAENVQVDDYGHVGQGLKDYFEQTILIDPDEVNYTLYGTLGNAPHYGTRTPVRVIEETSPVPAMKAVKNEAEQQGFRRAMERDGVAMVRFLKELDEVRTELGVARQLELLRAAQPHYRGLSFDTIAAYGPHGAIVHYEPTEESDVALQPEGLLLVDSGAQYDDGTTDITRTIALGPLTDEMRRVYTLVLKGHLRLQNLVFPDGAAGTQLDAIARSELWREGYNYLHGTGHGVGSCLNVHEGPHQIRMEWRGQPLRAGMTVTDEPGIYLEGRFGVRIENTLLIVPAKETQCGRFLRFEPLTLCPIDKRPIVVEMLTDEERCWLNDYHQMVFDRLSPLLTREEGMWLREACAAV
jgi:Xaa-Pro aminopeptidase